MHQITSHDEIFLTKIELSPDVFDVLMSETPWKQIPITVYGRRVMQPRLISLYGHDYSYSGITLRGLPYTQTITDIKNEVEEASGEKFNSVLVNLYRDGGDYIGWHSDDEPELGPNPTIASVSLGAPRLFQMQKNDLSDHLDLTLVDGALLVMAGDTQKQWKHRLPKVNKQDTKPRINLTFRRIL